MIPFDSGRATGAFIPRLRCRPNDAARQRSPPGCSPGPDARRSPAVPAVARPLLAQINLAALRSNLARARDAAPGAKILAVVKANAYGHGLTRVLPALDDADGLALVELDAASTLREHLYTRRILLIEGFFEERELAEISQRRLATVVHSEDQARMLELAVLPRALEVFVKVNTGMNRLGFAGDEV